MVVCAALSLAGCATATARSPVARPPAGRTAVDLCAGVGAPAIALVNQSVVLSLARDGRALTASADVWVHALRGRDQLLTGYLRALGAHEAAELTMLGDGAKWIWERVAPLTKAIGIEPEKASSRPSRPAPRFGAEQVWAGCQTSAWSPTLQDPAQRASLLLDQLRCDLGDQVFWDGISRYVKAGQGAAPGGGGVRSDDLRVALEAASGRDLKPLWAERVYAPFFDWSASSPCASQGP